MDESYFKEKLSAYLDKSLSPEEMAMMDEYVKEHGEARLILDDYKKLNDLVEKHSGLGESDYWERSARRIEEAIGLEYDTGVTDIKPKARIGFIWKITAVAASAALLIFIGIHQWEILEQQKDEVVPSQLYRSQEAAPAPSESAAVAESTQVFDVESSEESEAGEGTPLQSEVKPSPKVADELGEIDKSVGIPQPPPAKEQTEAGTTVLNSSMSRQETELGKSITVTPAPPAPVPSNEVQPPGTIHIRGGRSGETTYTVTPSDTSLPPAGVAEDYATEYGVLSQKAEGEGDTAYVIPAELTSYQRDSLLTYFRAEREAFMEAPAGIEPKIAMPSLTPGLREEKQKGRTQASASAKQPKTSLSPEDEKLMLTASYVVAMLSPDESERDEAFDYVLLVAEDTTSVHQALADDYLIELQNQRIDRK